LASLNHYQDVAEISLIMDRWQPRFKNQLITNEHFAIWARRSIKGTHNNFLTGFLCLMVFWILTF